MLLKFVVFFQGESIIDLSCNLYDADTQYPNITGAGFSFAVVWGSYLFSRKWTQVERRIILTKDQDLFLLYITRENVYNSTLNKDNEIGILLTFDRRQAN